VENGAKVFNLWLPDINPDFSSDVVLRPFMVLRRRFLPLAEHCRSATPTDCMSTQPASYIKIFCFLSQDKRAIVRRDGSIRDYAHRFRAQIRGLHRPGRRVYLRLWAACRRSQRELKEFNAKGEGEQIRGSRGYVCEAGLRFKVKRRKPIIRPSPASISDRHVVRTTSRNPGQHAFCTDVFVDIGPVHALTVSDKLPVIALFRRCL
jgi:hypothetical protein